VSKIDANEPRGLDVCCPRCGGGGVGVVSIFFLWLDNEHSAVFAGCLCSAGFVTLCGYGCLLRVLLLGGVRGATMYINGEFDPGSGRTLAACLTHASRTVILGACFRVISGERVSNT
jgi:hypothetical protein